VTGAAYLELQAGKKFLYCPFSRCGWDFRLRAGSVSGLSFEDV